MFLREENELYSENFEEYKDEYWKRDYDIKLKTGEIVFNCYPNAGKFNSLSFNRQVLENEIAEIRFAHTNGWHINPKNLYNNPELPKKQILLYLDDSRDPSFYLNNDVKYQFNIIWVKSYEEFVNWIDENGIPGKISFDYCLGNDGYNGLSCVKHLVKYCIENKLLFPRFEIHSTHYEKDNLRELIMSYIQRYNLGSNKDELYIEKINHKEEISNDNWLIEPIKKFTLIKNSPKTGRNEKCNCGSGKKYKHCCGK